MFTLFKLTAIVAIIAFILLAIRIVKRDKKALVKYLLAGFIATGIYSYIEFLGTHSKSGWIYYESLYLIFGKMPIEFIALFFLTGIVAASLFWGGDLYFNPKIKGSAFNYNNILYLLILIGVVAYTYYMFLGEYIYLLVIMVPFGLWGMVNIKQKNLEVSLLVAIGVFISDLVIETIYLTQGSYHYIGGFSILIPMEYALATLGFFGLMEKFDKLDKFIESKFIRSLIKKSVYRRREQFKKALRHLNNQMPKL